MTINDSKTLQRQFFLCYLPNLCALVSFQLSVRFCVFAVIYDRVTLSPLLCSEEQSVSPMLYTQYNIGETLTVCAIKLHQ